MTPFIIYLPPDLLEQVKAQQHRRLKAALKEILCDDLDGFIEHEQDRGLKISSVRNRVASLQVFLKFLIEAEIVNPEVLSQPIRHHNHDLMGGAEGRKYQLINDFNSLLKYI